MEAAAQDQRIKVSKQFRDDFEKVIKFYELDAEQIEKLRRAARKDYESMKLSMACMAREIDTGMLDIGIPIF